MSTEKIKFSSAELRALMRLQVEHSILVSRIEDKSYSDSFGDTIPGMNIFKKLEKKGYCFQTEEEPMDDGFVFTESIELTEMGEVFVKNHLKDYI